MVKTLVGDVHCARRKKEKRNLELYCNTECNIIPSTLGTPLLDRWCKGECIKYDYMTVSLDASFNKLYFTCEVNGGTRHFVVESLFIFLMA